MLLYEQGVLDMNADDSRYQSLSSGSMGAYEFMSYVISNKIITVGQLALKPCSRLSSYLLILIMAIFWHLFHIKL